MLALFNSLMSKLPLNGWKSILAYIVAAIPHDGSFGILADPLTKALQEPNAANISNAIGSALLALFLLHTGVKNIIASTPANAPQASKPA